MSKLQKPASGNRAKKLRRLETPLGLRFFLQELALGGSRTTDLLGVLLGSTTSLFRQELDIHNTLKSTALIWLRNGYFPSTSAEIDQIEAFVNGCRSLSVLCEREITMNLAYSRDLRGVKALRTLRGDLASWQKTAQSFTSPIRKLPADILYEIFEQLKYLRPLKSSGRRGSLRFHMDTSSELVNPSSTLGLSWVCAYWRSLVNAQPTLWNSIRIEVSSVARSAKLLSLFRHHIVRSARAPLTLDIWGWEWEWKPKYTIYPSVLDVLFANLHRWYHVDFHFVGNPLFTDSFINYYREDREHLVATSVLLSLEYLDLGQTKFPMQLLSLCPRLKVFKATSISWDTSSICDFGQLKVFEVGSILTDASFAEILMAMPQLEHFAIMTRVESRESNYNTSSIHPLPTSPYTSKLASLSVSLKGIRLGAWRNLLLPCLDTFNCCAGQQFEQQFLEVSALLYRSECKLERAALTKTPAQLARDFLDLHPSVSSLIYSVEIPGTPPNDVLTVLGSSCRDDRSIVAPNLHTLAINNTSNNTLETVDRLIEDICTMISSRSGKMSRLKTVILGTDYLGLGPRERLQNRLVSESIQVKYDGGL
ncbi:hypothetical protein D9757_000395 [Collybiopsis confluens]|uniref:F-box domain-containing protein n=1 Tax=Collybiopsis confluens TaxID=2823264 RepID=A0A8H5I2G0_9AGAR|nr:hypothetical protein D9757_000395 [Collybiopsis confluens]